LIGVERLSVEIERRQYGIFGSLISDCVIVLNIDIGNVTHLPPVLRLTLNAVAYFPHEHASYGSLQGGVASSHHKY
jgi:hypothetical protein